MLLRATMAEPAPASAPEARSFYRRPLPVSCVAFGSAEGRCAAGARMAKP